MNNKEAYNAWAAIYDSNENKTRDLDLDITQKVLANYQFEDVLEIGCGTGKNTKWLVESASNIWAMDFSREMLTHLKRKLKGFSLEIIEADINENWPIQDNLVDLAIANLVLEHIQNLEHVFEEAARVLRKDGLFFISEFHPFRQYVGKKARFEQKGNVLELDCYVHHVSEYLLEAKKAGFECVDLQEWFDEENKEKPPRIVSFVFKRIE
jgi:ubiquinone/menaquinone biosynthesis C-methylase UbiE